MLAAVCSYARLRRLAAGPDGPYPLPLAMTSRKRFLNLSRGPLDTGKESARLKIFLVTQIVVISPHDVHSAPHWYEIFMIRLDYSSRPSKRFILWKSPRTMQLRKFLQLTYQNWLSL